MKYIKKYEGIKDKYNKGDYVIFSENKYKFNNAKNNAIISAGKPYEIVDIKINPHLTNDNNFDFSIIIYDDNNEKRPISFIEKSMKKISTEKALVLLAKEKYNI